MSSIRCDECGASPREESAKFCPFCGALLPRPPRPSERSDRDRTRARFEALSDHPDAKDELARPPSGREVVARHTTSTVGSLIGAGFVVVFAIVFIKTSSSMRSRFDDVPGPSMPGFPEPRGIVGIVGFMDTVVPLLMIGAAIFWVVKSLGKASEVAGSPVRSSLGHVVDESVKQRGRGEDRRLVHVITLENREGERRAFEVSDSVAASITRGDMGVVHSRGRELVRFARIDV